MRWSKIFWENWKYDLCLTRTYLCAWKKDIIKYLGTKIYGSGCKLSTVWTNYNWKCETVIYLFYMYRYIVFLLRHLFTFSLIRGRETFSERVKKMWEQIRANLLRWCIGVFCEVRFGLHLQNNNNSSFPMECWIHRNACVWNYYSYWTRDEYQLIFIIAGTFAIVAIT